MLFGTTTDSSQATVIEYGPASISAEPHATALMKKVYVAEELLSPSSKYIEEAKVLVSPFSALAVRDIVES